MVVEGSMDKHINDSADKTRCVYCCTKHDAEALSVNELDVSMAMHWHKHLVNVQYQRKHTVRTQL